MEQKPVVSTSTKPEDAHLWVNLKVRNQVGASAVSAISLLEGLTPSPWQSTHEETCFRIKRASQLQKMMDAYAARQKIEVRAIRCAPSAAIAEPKATCV
jgi:hypothetical protein